MDANTKLIQMLADSDLFQSYERAFNETTGLPLALRPVQTWQLPFHGRQKENAFCALTAEKSRSCAACLRLQDQLTHDAQAGAVTRTCAYGLCETAVPVKLGPQLIGFLQTGQVMSRKPTAASFRRAVIKARKFGVDLDNDPARQAYFSTPVVSRHKQDSLADLLVIFADHLSLKGNQIMVQAVHAEPPNMTKAKAFIREHFAENLTLRQAANAVNMSLFYFCKKFHKSTGFSFTEFVALTRIEKAGKLLLNPNLRISEIAFAVGFQSLTHFNRAFKRIMRQSPTQYRGALAAVV